MRVCMLYGVSLYKLGGIQEFINSQHFWKVSVEDNTDENIVNLNHN